MPRLQEGNRSRPQVSSESGGAFAPQGIGRQTAAAGARLGEAINAFGVDDESQKQELFAIEASSQLNEGRISYKEQIAGLEAGFEGRTDFGKHGAEWDKRQGEIVQSISRDITNPRAREAFGLYARDQAVSGGESFRRGASVRMLAKARGDIPKFIEGSAIEASTIPEGPGHDQKMAEEREKVASQITFWRENGLIAEKEDLVLMRQYDQAAKGFIEERDVKAFEDAVEAIAETDGRDVAMEMAPDLAKEFDVGDKVLIDVLREQETVQSFDEAQVTEELEGRRTEDRQRILDEIIVPQDYDDIIGKVNSTSLSPEDKISTIKLLEARAKAISSGDLDPYQQSDSKTVLEFERRIGLNPLSVNEDELYAAVGKGIKGGLTVAQYTGFLKRTKDPGFILNSTVAKQASARFSNMQSNGTFSSIDDQLNDDVWLRVDTQYKEWIQDFSQQNKRLPTSEESRIFEQVLITPILIGKIEKFNPTLSGFIFGRGVSSAEISGIPETEKEVQKELSELPVGVIEEVTEASRQEIDTREFLGKFKQRKKPLTRDIARHFLRLTGNDVEKAQVLIDKWNYSE